MEGVDVDGDVDVAVVVDVHVYGNVDHVGALDPTSVATVSSYEGLRFCIYNKSFVVLPPLLPPVPRPPSLFPSENISAFIFRFPRDQNSIFKYLDFVAATYFLAQQRISIRRKKKCLRE